MNLTIKADLTNPAVVPLSKRLSLRINFSFTFLGNVLYAASQWAFLILLAKTLNTSAVGEFAFALAVTAPIMLFANQGLTGLQATDAVDEFSFREYFLCRLVTTTLALVTIFVLSRILHWSDVVLVVGVAKAAEALSDIKYGLYQKLDRMDRTATSMVLRGSCSLLIAGGAMFIKPSILCASGALLAGNLLILILVDYRPYLRSLISRPQVLVHTLRDGLRSATRMRSLGLQAFPLGLAAMLGSLISGVPRYFLEHFSGTARLGIFAALMYLLVAGRTIVVALAQSCVAQLSRLYVQGCRSAFNKLLGKQMLLGVILGAGGIFISVIIGKELLRMLYRPEYAEYSDVLVIVMIAAALNYLAEFSNGGLLAVRMLRIQPLILLVCCLATVVLSALLIPKFGIMGAAWAVLVTSAMQLAANLACLSRSRFPEVGPAL